MQMRYNAQAWYWTVGGDTSRVWSSAGNGFVSSADATYQDWISAGGTPTKVPSVSVALGVVITQTGLLDASDTTMHRVTEAVALGQNSWTNADVVAWVNYRRALRAIIDGSDTTSIAIPARPAYPSGT
jgi:hypothetical protein